MSLGGTVRQYSLGGPERLFEIGDDIVNVLCADGNSDSIFSHTRISALLLGQLLMSGRPRVYGESLRVSNTAIILVNTNYPSGEGRTWQD